jgi:hypothetical protein
MGQLNRITQNPAVMGGKACICGMRVTVGMIVGQTSRGKASSSYSPAILTLSAKTSFKRSVMPQSRLAASGRKVTDVHS